MGSVGIKLHGFIYEAFIILQGACSRLFGIR